MRFKVVGLLTLHEYATSSICHSEELCDEESLSPLETQLLVTLASFDYGVDYGAKAPPLRMMEGVYINSVFRGKRGSLPLYLTKKHDQD
jgi:hypothetical protein